MEICTEWHAKSEPKEMAWFDPAGLIKALDEADVDYVLVGGLAASALGLPRGTEDMDILASTEADNLQRIHSALLALKARLRIAKPPYAVDFDPHPSLLKQQTMLTMTTTSGDLDLLFEADGIGGYDDIEPKSETYELYGCLVKIAHIDDIIASKQAAGRQKDIDAMSGLNELRSTLEERKN